MMMLMLRSTMTTAKSMAIMNDDHVDDDDVFAYEWWHGEDGKPSSRIRSNIFGMLSVMRPVLMMTARVMSLMFMLRGC